MGVVIEREHGVVFGEGAVHGFEEISLGGLCVVFALIVGRLDHPVEEVFATIVSNLGGHVGQEEGPGELEFYNFVAWGALECL